MATLCFLAHRHGLCSAIIALPSTTAKNCCHRPPFYYFSTSLARSLKRLTSDGHKFGHFSQIKSIRPTTKSAFKVTVTRHCQKQGQGQSQFTQNRFFASKIPYQINRNISRDVLVYSHKNDSFYKMLSYFGLFQMAMWTYLSLFAVPDLKSTPTFTQDTSDMPWWKKLFYKEAEYKNAISLFFLLVGGSVAFITLTYPRRAIRTLWLLKGGNDVKITTHSWLGRTNTFNKPVEHINCLQSRTGAGNHIPLRVKGKNFYFLLDKQGEFHNTDLFDYVIGLERKI